MSGIIPNPSVFLLMASGQIESAVVSDCRYNLLVDEKFQTSLSI